MYADAAYWITIYTREAHPISGRPMEYSYDSQGNPIEQAANYEDRLGMARQTIEEANLTTLVLVDEIDNPVWCSYGQMPNNAYLIGQDGRVIVYQKWNDPLAMEAALIDLLSQ